LKNGVSLAALEIWFADEARIGQKNKIARRWARRGTRPAAPHDQRTASTYIFGAICPYDGKGAGLVLPLCNTEAMDLHLQEIGKAVAQGKHAVLLLDQAGWHMSNKLTVPANVTLVPLPPKCPELNPTENVWQFMRDMSGRRPLSRGFPKVCERLGCGHVSGLFTRKRSLRWP
jgi:hypothetical protein